ncbi:MAG: polyisoprenoid-binding protein [Candidatus Competibacter sp.]|nr:polyisoprenoid-binding protein [Candidatus Competibacter sp.]
MTKAIGVATVAALLSWGSITLAQAAPEKYVLDNSHTYPYFEVVHLGWSTTRGLFHKTSGAATLDFAAKTGSVEVVIDAGSLDTAYPKRDEHLRGEDFFDVAKYPTIAYRADRIQFEGNKPVKAEGQLTLRGITKPVTLAFTRFKCGEHPIAKKHYCGGDATATIKRSDFGMGAFPNAVSDDVKLSIAIEAAREP